VIEQASDERARVEASAQLMEFDMMKAIQSALDHPPMPTVSTVAFDASGLVPIAAPKANKKGFRGARGVGRNAYSEATGSGESAKRDFEPRPPG